MNTVRLASDRASTGCWRRSCPFSRFPDRCEPLQENKVNNDDALRTWSVFNGPPRYTCPPTIATGLASPHQNDSWQSRKAAVCSHHLKVHLHTLPVPTKSVGPKLPLPGQREWAPETRDQHARGLFFFCSSSKPLLKCIFKLFFHFFFQSHQRQTFHLIFFPPEAKRVLIHGAGPQKSPVTARLVVGLFLGVKLTPKHSGLSLTAPFFSRPVMTLYQLP